jgi:hypothetical protein
MAAQFEVGQILHDRDGRPVGKITANYLYPAGVGTPEGAVVVMVGLLRGAHLVDLEGAAEIDGGLTVPHARRTITSAPYFAPDVGDTLSEGEAVKVREHYWGAAQPV